VGVAGPVSSDIFLLAPYRSRANWRDPLCGWSKRRVWFQPSWKSQTGSWPGN